jgi:hypothetical protein
MFIRAHVHSSCNRFRICGGGVDECVLWLSFAQQKLLKLPKDVLLASFFLQIINV